jgi:mannonate dehydratase
MAITIRSIRVILTAPVGFNLVAVKVETSEPGLYGVGCATYTQRFMAVKAAIEEHLAPLVIGREVERIEELWQLMNVHGYWRNGPVVNNAMSGIDMALWDIKGKLAKMPLHQLLGGKVREAAAAYIQVNETSIEAMDEKVRALRAAGLRHIRVQLGAKQAAGTTNPYGGAAYGGGRPEGALEGAYYDPRQYMSDNLHMLEHMREAHGDEVELIHDIHERLRPALAVEFAKQCEKLRLFYLEDALAPEDNAWFENIRASCTTPLAMGELFTTPTEWNGLVSKRQIDFTRMHMSAIGGITPARKVAALCEAFGVKTAWHGPPDVTGIGHAANVHLDLVSPSFGVQEWCPGGDPMKRDGILANLYEVFPGTPELRKGYLYVSDRPGLGVDVDEAAAAKWPAVKRVDTWTQARLPDGSVTRP